MKARFAAAIFAGMMGCAYAQAPAVAVDKDKHRNTDHNPVQWNVTRSGQVDTLVVQTSPKQFTGAPTNFATASADATVFTLAAGEIGFIQNLSADAPLAVKKGAGASTTSFNFILAKSTADSDGTGGVTRIDDWVGPVSVAKMAGTAKYIAWKQAP